MTTPPCWLLAATLCAAIPWAHAETIFRCGNSYADVPCPSAKALEAEGRATAAQRAEASDVALREMRLAAAMSRERREQEASLRPALAGSFSAPRAAAAAASAPNRKPAHKPKKSAAPDDGRDFVAVAPRARKPPR